MKNTFSTMGPSIRVSGTSQTRDMVWALRSGQMEPSTRGIGKTTWQMAEASSFMPMGRSMKETGNKTKRTGEGSLFMLTGPNTTVNGVRTCSTGKVWKHGWMALVSKGATPMASSRGQVHTFGQMAASIKEIITKIPCMDMYVIFL